MNQDLSAKEMAMILYKLSVENNAMLRACMDDNVQILKLLRELQMYARSGKSETIVERMEEMMDDHAKRKTRHLNEYLLALEDVARTRVMLWAINPPDNLSGIGNTYDTETKI